MLVSCSCEMWLLFSRLVGHTLLPLNGKSVLWLQLDCFLCAECISLCLCLEGLHIYLMLNEIIFEH